MNGTEAKLFQRDSNIVDKTSFKLRPLADHVVVEALEEEQQTASGLLLPETAKDKPPQGLIVAAGRVGGTTKTELKEKKQRGKDALSATRKAVEEEVVPGGAVAFLNVIPALDKVGGTGDYATGVQIFRCALEEPLR